MFEDGLVHATLSFSTRVWEFLQVWIEYHDYPNVNLNSCLPHHRGSVGLRIAIKIPQLEKLVGKIEAQL